MGENKNDNYWRVLSREDGQRRNEAPGQDNESRSAIKGVHPRKPWGPALAGLESDVRLLPYPWTKNFGAKKSTTSTTKPKEKVFRWGDHRAWCEKMWADGPRKYKLKVAALKIAETQAKWFQNGEEHKVPIFSEGRERGIIAEVYYMHHLPSSKGYVGLAYHGAHDRMQSHWSGRNREQDPSSVMMKESQTQFE